MQNRVTSTQRTQWGSYKDRKNSFDDEGDIRLFMQLVQENQELKQYLKQYIPKGNYRFVPKPDGEYGVDLSLQNEQNEIVLTIDIERWSQWVDDWPDYYKHIHFLGRKEKFIQPDIPFFMGYMNYHRTKVLMISKEDIQKYPTIDKYFRRKQTTDRLKELPMSEGYVFGENITEKERRLFK